MKFVYGVLFTLLVSNFCNYARLQDVKAVHDLAAKVQFNVLEGNYLIYPLTNRCNDDFTEPGLTTAEFFGCDSFQRMINL